MTSVRALLRPLLGRLFGTRQRATPVPREDPLQPLRWSLALHATACDGTSFVMLLRELNPQRARFRCFLPIAVGQRYRLEGEPTPGRRISFTATVSRAMRLDQRHYEGELLLELPHHGLTGLLEVRSAR